MTSSLPDRVFISYSHADQRWLDRLLKILHPVKSQLDVWSDHRIAPGALWKTEILDALASAKVAVLLVSSNFLASDFISKVELPIILKAEKRRKLTIVWIPLQDCLYEGTAIELFQAATDPKKPLESLPLAKKNAELTRIARIIIAAATSSAPATTSLPRRNEPRTVKAGEPEVEVAYRYDKEAQGKDLLLTKAKEAKFIALTYRTLGLALTSPEGIRQLVSLRHAEVAVYALPIVLQWHPTLRTKPDELAKEWKRGVTSVLSALTDRSRCPRLERLDIRVVNRVPTFTASVVTKDAEMRIRYTPVLEGENPTSTPTICLATDGTPKERNNQLFSAYARIVDNMRMKLNPLTFPVVHCQGPTAFVRRDIPQMVDCLATVCNHPDYGPADARFTVEFRITPELAREFECNITHSDKARIAANDVYRCFDGLRETGRTDQFQVTVDCSHHRAVIEVGKRRDSQWLKATIDGRHIIGAFALITKSTEGCEVLLKHKRKPPWNYDVPGGKTALMDKSIVDAVTREMFEELGIVAETQRVSQAVAYKYDPHSRKEGVPVIAVYFHYPLTSEESSYFDNFLPPDAREADEYPLTFCDIEVLIAKKRRHRMDLRKDIDDAEAECHAPLEAFEETRRILNESKGRCKRKHASIRR
jgi:8-oxo-dGTP pyrophosphatase MutT (NUDIX family)